MRSHVTSVSTSWTFGLNRRTYWENSFLLIFETLLGADICGLFDYLILDQGASKLTTQCCSCLNKCIVSTAGRCGSCSRWSCSACLKFCLSCSLYENPAAKICGNCSVPTGLVTNTHFSGDDIFFGWLFKGMMDGRLLRCTLRFATQLLKDSASCETREHRKI